VASNQQFKRLTIIGCNESFQQRSVFLRRCFIAQPEKVLLQRVD
jgi:hypothetical protein